MREDYDETPPVGVVPRREVRSIEPLMSDASETTTVAAEVEAPAERAPSAWAAWLPSVTAVTAIAGALEWLKLTR